MNKTEFCDIIGRDEFERSVRAVSTPAFRTSCVYCAGGTPTSPGVFLHRFTFTMP